MSENNKNTETLVNDIRDNDHTKTLQESIIASAVRGVRREEGKPTDPIIKTEVRVFIGKRHCHAMSEASREGFEALDRSGQGFLTSKNRYVDRQEAMIIACKFGQVTEEVAMRRDTDLYSEDLW